MLDPWSLRLLLEVHRLGSLSAAAESLSMTQPAVSRQIGGLEKRLGVPLFRRLPRGVRPTPAGEVAVELGSDILARLAALEARVAAFGRPDAGELRLTAFASANTFLVPEAIRRFTGAHPNVSVRLLDNVTPLAAVADGRADIALTTAWDLPTDLDVELVRLADERLLVALPADHPLAAATHVRLRDLAEQPWIEGAHPDCLGPVTRLTEALGGPPRIAFVCDDWGGKQALVAAGLGCALVPSTARAAIRDDVALLPPLPALPPRRLYAATAPAPYRSPAATAMLKDLKAVARA
jgi:DNA-binding transcriptional LysR family regulator